MSTTTESASAPETKTEEGTQVKGKDFIFLNAPEICFPENAPLTTEKRELYTILNELFGEGGEGGDVYLVSGSGSGITVTMVKNRGKTQELVSENFTFATKTYKTITTLKSGKTTIEKTWSKTVITKVLKDGVTVWKFVLDAVGTVTAVFDSAGNDVLNGITGEGGNSVITPTPEGIALGWALAYNDEQNSSLKKILDAYKDGADDCDEINTAEGVGGGGTGSDDGDGDDGGGTSAGDGTGTGDGTGDGSGSGTGKLPNKKFDAVELPEGMGAIYRYPYGYDYYYAKCTSTVYLCDHITFDEETGKVTIHAPWKMYSTYSDGSVTWNLGHGYDVTYTVSPIQDIKDGATFSGDVRYK